MPFNYGIYTIKFKTDSGTFRTVKKQCFIACTSLNR